MKYENQFYLAKGAGAFLAKQFLDLNWPFPDVIIPIPLTFTHFLDRGYNQSELMANALGKIINCPVKNFLCRKNEGYSQASLSYQERMLLKENTFYLYYYNIITL